ncbi:hypothetical protein L6164_037128 [Bauhinia variegata]|uniref:Uncharacterized protein n=1 Tax=Bauhinia variegata TaxID=167791 RepID=A0ACB9KJ48_BAUVA|nr:hypothetical protein L6164_037128 [Bauhinia variegata]
MQFSALSSKGSSENQNYEPKISQGIKWSSSSPRTSGHTSDHILAQRKRREKGPLHLRKKMDKVSVLGVAIKHAKELQERLKMPEGQTEKRTVELVAFVKKSQLSSDDDNSEGEGVTGESLPEVEARIELRPGIRVTDDHNDSLSNTETTLRKVEKSSLMLTYEINVVGPILVIKHMWPLLKAGGGSGTERSVAVVASLSARVGSIGDNRLGGWHSYRSSKAALNQYCFSGISTKEGPNSIYFIEFGTVDTDLSKPFQRNVPPDKLFTKEFSVQKLLTIINNTKIQDNGKFFAWDGQEIPW